MTTLAEYEATFDTSTKVWMVFCVLRDHRWHCRQCEYGHVASTQLAGGAGIQGLQRGTGSRPGLDIESGDHLCTNCGQTTRQDRWQGNFTPAIPSASMPASFVRRAVTLLGSRDIVELTDRPTGQLTVDHKLPMMRWNTAEQQAQTDFANMSDQDIRDRFQLLKKSNGSVSHNLLKSRACERCYKTGNRGEPFGIRFFYAGNGKWAPAVQDDPSGCDGCGWYDFDAWRTALNKTLRGT
ncbi:restriction endonuclease [Candidatus Poriferisodalis sp.]|uniref:restriction endonuclease n=1 Tax=Candidatus Poriferisodalis sp. TaxID=3101277 RepID=UPI003B016580